MTFDSTFSDSAMFSSTVHSRIDLWLFWGRRQWNNLTIQEIWRNLSHLEDCRWPPESWQVCGFTVTHSELPLTTFCNLLKRFVKYQPADIALLYYANELKFYVVKDSTCMFPKQLDLWFLSNRWPGINFQNKL